MVYKLSASKLKYYNTCPQAYYFKYERKLKDKGSFAQPDLGIALHDALASFYEDWHYCEPIPPQSRLHDAWGNVVQKLTPNHQAEGWRRLQLYYQRFILEPGVMVKPLGIEQWVKSTVFVDNIEFELRGRYDRLDMTEGRLTLIDYKSGSPPRSLDDLDLQLGFYDWILEGIYQHSLTEWQLIYLKTGELISYPVTDEHRAMSRELMANLAQAIKSDQEWTPCPGDHCDKCSFKIHCPVWNSEPIPLPEETRQAKPVQFSLRLI